MFVDSVQVPALEALRIGWRVLCGTIRSWSVSSREGFAEWMHRQGFGRPRWGAHFSGRIQERVVVRNVRVVALGTFYVHLVMQACSSERAAAPPEVGPRATADRAPAVGETQWNCLDDNQLQEIFQMRFRVLQSCPAHLKAKYRVALTIALEAVHEAAQRRDPVKEVRAWKLFSLLPYWLLRKPLGQGRVGKAELSDRFELFTGGQWDSLHVAATRDPFGTGS